MLRLLKSIVTPPVFENEDKSRNARLAHIVILSTLTLIILALVLDYVFAPFTSNLVANVGVIFIQVILLYLIRRGYPRQVGVIFTLFCWIIVTYVVYKVDGLVNPSAALYVIPILIAGLLINERAGLAIAVLSIITSMCFALAAEAGLYPQIESKTTLITRLGNYISIYGFTGIALYLSVGGIRNALERTRVTEAQLRESNRLLKAEIETRERVQKELEVSELRWRFALEGSDTGVWDSNLETGEVYRSPRYLELMGYTAEEIAAIPDTTTLFHPDDYDRVTAKSSLFMQGRNASYKDEFRMHCGDGTYKWFMYRGTVMEYKADGTVRRITGTLADISARKKIEEALIASEQEYRTLFDNNPNPMWVFDKETLGFVAVNDAALALYGYSREEFLGMTLRDIRPEEDIPLMEQEVSRQMAFNAALTNRADIWRHRTRDGVILYVDVIGHETVFHDKAARLILVHDVTAQKETEESLDNTQQLFALVFDTVPVGIALSRISDGRFISVNPYLATMLEYEREDMLGHTPAELKLTDEATHLKGLEEFQAQKTTSETRETRFATRTGRTIDVLIILSTKTVRLMGEEVALSMAVDITDIKRIERERMQIEMLQSEIDTQREVVELKERFISGVSHEFRSPLAIMLSGTGILRIHGEKYTLEQRIARLEKIETQIYYLNGLLDRVLTLSKARAGKFPFNPRQLDIVKYCRDVFEDFQLTDNHNHEFVFELVGDFDQANMDDKLIQHILMNLISNAIKYSPTGKEVKLLMEREGNDVVIAVSDQGIGIPKEEHNQVFEPFFRSKNVETIKGTGLGLAITKESVDAHQGEIMWRSQTGEGTTFTVRLPGGFQPATVAES